jgi:DNA-binding SARP family transcriptional activator
MMSQLKVYLLGKFEVCDQSGAIGGLDVRKVQELLAFLLISRPRPHTRESLANLLWCNSDAQQSRRNLRKAVWQLQSALQGERGLPAEAELLDADAEWLCISAGSPIWVDCIHLEQAYAGVRDIPGRQLTTDQYRSLREVLPLYRGDLLEGCYEDWCLCERERLQHLYLTILDKLMAYCEAQGSYQEGLDYGYIILRHDRARELTHRRLMRLRFRAGDRSGALRQYRQCVELLAQELGVEPTRQTQELAEQLRAGVTPEALAAGVSPGSPPETEPLQNLLAPLQELQRALASFEFLIRNR